MTWTRFWDMHSGGGLKEAPYSMILIEAPEAEAKSVFYARFGHNPERVSCTCCGEDYSIDSAETLEQLTGYHRGCAYVYFNDDGTEMGEDVRYPQTVGKASRYIERPTTRFRMHDYKTVDDSLKEPHVLVIRASEITDEQRRTRVPEQGYVWRD